MVRKPSTSKKNIRPPRSDNLRLIKGITPRIEKKLNDSVGCFTFAQLAAMTPADIAKAVIGLADLTRERIIEQDWIGQARKLAAGEAELHVEDTTSIEPPVTIVSVQTTPRSDIPEQTAETNSEVAYEEIRIPIEYDQIAEANSKVTHEEIEAPATLEQDTSFTTPVESPSTLEHLPSALSPVEPETDAMPPTQPYHPVSFTVEFLLDENNSVESTHVIHNQSGHEHIWAGWQVTKLVDFMAENAALNILSDEPTPPIVEEPIHSEELELTPAVISENEPLAPLAERVGLTGTLHLRAMEILEADAANYPRTLIHNKPFNMRLTLDLTELQVPANTPLNYNASIFGKSSRTGLILGETQGTITPDDTIIIKVKGNTPLEMDIYQLVATVIVGLPTMKLRIKRGITSVLDGGQIKVL